MTVRIGINGFGRMGRLVVRAMRLQPQLRLVRVNEHKVVGSPSRMVIDGRMAKGLVWYDNEYGFVHRTAELATIVGATIDRRP